MQHLSKTITHKAHNNWANKAQIVEKAKNHEQIHTFLTRAVSCNSASFSYERIGDSVSHLSSCIMSDPKRPKFPHNICKYAISLDSFCWVSTTTETGGNLWDADGIKVGWTLHFLVFSSNSLYRFWPHLVPNLALRLTAAFIRRMLVVLYFISDKDYRCKILHQHFLDPFAAAVILHRRLVGTWIPMLPTRLVISANPQMCSLLYFFDSSSVFLSHFFGWIRVAVNYTIW